MIPEDKRKYVHLSPSHQLSDFVDSYWEHKNLTDKYYGYTIFPDSFFKVIIHLVDGKLKSCFMTGLWTKEIEIKIPARATVYGIKFKLLAPEYLLKREVASILQSQQDLELDFWNVKSMNFENFDLVVQQIEEILTSQLANKIEDKKLNLSQLLYKMQGNITVEEVAKQVGWSRRQINRYLNKYLGVSLKPYLNIQKVYAAYIPIREGKFFPGEEFYDQSHFIKEIKKHTSKTPKELYQEQSDRFIQLKNIKKK